MNDHRDMLLRMRQVDLSSIERERLERLCLALLEGQLMIIETIEEETRHTTVIRSQQAIIEGLTQSLETANAALGSLRGDDIYRDLFVAMADHVASSWDIDRQGTMLGVLDGMSRSVAEAHMSGLIGPDTAAWWDRSARSAFGLPVPTSEE